MQYIHNPEELDELRLGCIFISPSEGEFAYQKLPDGEGGSIILAVGIEEEYAPGELDYPLVLVYGGFSA